jgi:hypothetical protein
MGADVTIDRRIPLNIGDGFINLYKGVYVIVGKNESYFFWLCPNGTVVKDAVRFREDFKHIVWF